MAATEQPTSKQVIRILKIHNHHEQPAILQLPRELRDMIFEFALNEPTLYNKRHQPTCHFHNDASANQVPPAIIHYDSDSKLQLDQGKVQKCKLMCLRRQGFGLMKGVNKQIQDEASEIFWKHNMPCFTKHNDMVWTLWTLQNPALEMIQRISLWERETGHEGRSWGASQDWEAKLFAQLRRMSNLKHLELTTPIVMYKAQDILSIPTLKTFRLWDILRVAVINGDETVHVYVGCGGQWTLTPLNEFSIGKKYKGSNSAMLEWYWRRKAWGKEKEISSLAYSFWRNSISYRGVDWRPAAQKKLGSLGPGQPGEEPFRMKTVIAKALPWEVHRQFDVTEPELHEMHVWGLPIHNAEVRAVEARKADKKERLARMRTNKPLIVRYENPVEEPRVSSYTERRAREREQMAVWKKEDEKKRMEEEYTEYKKHQAEMKTVGEMKRKQKAVKKERMDGFERKATKKAQGKKAGRVERFRG